jgi:hypothetical protein
LNPNPYSQCKNKQLRTQTKCQKIPKKKRENAQRYNKKHENAQRYNKRHEKMLKKMLKGHYEDAKGF